MSGLREHLWMKARREPSHRELRQVVDDLIDDPSSGTRQRFDALAGDARVRAFVVALGPPLSPGHYAEAAPLLVSGLGATREELLGALHDPDPPVRAMAAAGLGEQARRGSGPRPEAPPPLLDRAEAEDRTERGEAVRALSRFGRGAVPVLCRALADRSLRLHGYDTDEAARDRLLEAARVGGLDDADRAALRRVLLEPRGSALDILVANGPPGIVACLQELAQANPRSELVVRTRDCLKGATRSATRDSSVVELARTLLDSPNTHVRSLAASLAVESDVRLRDPDAAVRARAVIDLHRQGDEASLGLVIDALMSDSSWEVRDAAAMRLGLRLDPGAIESLRERLEAESHPGVRKRVEASLRKLEDERSRRARQESSLRAARARTARARPSRAPETVDVGRFDGVVAQALRRAETDVEPQLRRLLAGGASRLSDGQLRRVLDCEDYSFEDWVGDIITRHVNDLSECRRLAIQELRRRGLGPYDSAGLRLCWEEALGAREFRLEEGEFRIGRGEECEIRLRDFGLSRYHAKIVVAGGRATLFDTKSKGGSEVNGRSVIECELHDGDQIRLGTVRFRFEAKPSSGGESLPAEDREALISPERDQLLAMEPGSLAIHIQEMWERQSRHDPDTDVVYGAGQIARRRGLVLEKALLDWVQTDDRQQRIVVAAMFLHPYWLDGERIEVRLAERLLEALETHRWEPADEEIIAAALAQGFDRVEDEGLRARVRRQVAELTSRAGPVSSPFSSIARKQVLGE